MATTDKDDIERQINDQTSPRTEPEIGPSDSSDTASEMPANVPSTDSDRENTGERAGVTIERDQTGDDLEPDKVAPDDEAGLAHTPPDPVENGGRPD